MENIRSYVRAEVEFPNGKTLFEGDIGSGKSTILMAVEFALFGLGSARASSLLRHREARGNVELDFEAGGREYTVRRVLARKAGSIQQVEGKIAGPDGEEDYPATEMKERILAILNFREPTDPRSRSLIYTYAVYTPQEEMKQVLLHPEIRTQTLRRAFGVEDYKVATENTEELLRRIEGKKSQFEVAAREIPALKKEMRELEAKVEDGNKDLARLEKAQKEQEESVARLEKERENLHEVEMQLTNALSDQRHLTKELERREREVEDLETEIESLEEKRKRLGSMAEGLGKAPTTRSLEELKGALAGARRDLSRHEADNRVIADKIGDYESVARDGKCPFCGREANPEDFVKKAGELSGERERKTGHVRRLTGEIEELEVLVEKVRAYGAASDRASENASLAREHLAEAEKRRKQLAALKAAAITEGKKLSELGGRIEVLEAETKNLGPLRKKLDAARSELGETKERAAGVRSDVRGWETDVRRCSDSISRKERSAAHAAALGERAIWLEEFFIPTLAAIEKHVMVSINRELGSSFQRWFGMLFEDTGKEARIDENFAPLVEQDGYDQDVEFLSGGERTSVALAYRLALSQMVQKLVESGPTSLILDEPTDGFSKEQLGKVREVLDELATPQVVIVSHERELESMADQIYRVAKVDGESRITR